jgi:hypothetical protein
LRRKLLAIKIVPQHCNNVTKSEFFTSRLYITICGPFRIPYVLTLYFEWFPAFKYLLYPKLGQFLFLVSTGYMLPPDIDSLWRF